MNIQLYENDLPHTFDDCTSVAIDTETLGLRTYRDRLCLVQLSFGDGIAHLVHFKDGQYEAPNLKKLLGRKELEKIFHFARFDIAALFFYLGVLCENVFCTKIASKLARTFTARHGLKDLCRDLLNVDISKEEQQSDWGAPVLTQHQLTYAATDVLYLHELKQSLATLLEREGRYNIALHCFDFIPYRSVLDCMGWNDEDIFSH